MFAVSDFPHIAAAIQDGIDRQLHTSVQIYISRNGVPILDSALGEASPGVPLTDDFFMPWRSAGKPLTAFLILKRIEAGQFRLSTPLQEVLPETTSTDKATVTLFDLLTHQSGFPATDVGWPQEGWTTSIQRAIEQPRQLPVGTAAYHPQSSWFLLGEILMRTASPSLEARDSFPDVLKHELLSPLSMSETTCGIPTEQLHDLAARLPTLYERDKGQLRPSPYCETPWLTRPSPGGNLRGPIRELGTFLEMLLRGGQTVDGRDVVSAAMIQQMTSRQRVGQYDQTLQHVLDFGLGVICNSNRYGVDTVPYGFGRYAGADAFGHGGSQCSMGFCDPEHGLVVAWSANGFCGEGQHQRRNRMINEAVYRDLALAVDA